VSAPGLHPQGLPRLFWIYLAAAALIAAGYTDFPLIAFHFQRQGSVPTVWIPILYSLAMGVDAIAALALGRVFDRRGPAMLPLIALLSAGFAPLVFLGGFPGAVLGMVLWGIGLGAQESVVRATVANLVPGERRGSAYGVFSAGFGFAWFLGSATMGVLYDVNLTALILFSVVLQLLSIPLLRRVASDYRTVLPAPRP
jgi:MFS family permease